MAPHSVSRIHSMYLYMEFNHDFVNSTRVDTCETVCDVKRTCNQRSIDSVKSCSCHDIPIFLTIPLSLSLSLSIVLFYILLLLLLLFSPTFSCFFCTLFSTLLIPNWKKSNDFIVIAKISSVHDVIKSAIRVKSA